MDDGINKALVFGSQILAVLVVVTGAALQKAQFKSARPPGGAQVLHDAESGDRYARLWEDPLEGMQAFTPKELKSAKKQESAAITELDQEVWEQQQQLQKQMQQLQRQLPQIQEDEPSKMPSGAEGAGATKTPEPTKPNAPDGEGAQEDNAHLVLWNIIDARPTPEARETRLRVRYALVSALVTAGYQPVDDAVLRALNVRPVGPLDAEAVERSERGEYRLVGFTEIFERKGPQDTLPRRITVAWHPLKKVGKLRSEAEDEKSGWPFLDFEVLDTREEVQAVLQSERRDTKADSQSEPSPGDRPRLLILHHGSSGDFSSYVRAQDLEREESNENLGRRVIFTRATAQPRVIAGVGKDDDVTPGSDEEKRVNIARSLQAGTPDETLIAELAKELKVRIPALSNGSEKRIVIFTESDGSYGRNLAQLVQDCLGTKDGSTKVEVYGYLRGLDGLPGEQEEDSAPDGGASKRAGLQEKNWGTSQYDYLRRIAIQLRGTYHSQSPVVAIGVLGSDVYDKLLVLQAVHPELPAALYFTTDVQSLFLGQKHLAFTRNLIVAAGEGLEIDDRVGHSGVATEGWRIPSMRDSYQTALVHTVWDHLAWPPLEDQTKTAKVWEVGQGKFVELDAGTRPDDPGWLMKLLAYVPVQFAIVFLGLVNAILILFAVLSRSQPGGDGMDGKAVAPQGSDVSRSEAGRNESQLGERARVFLGCEAIGAAICMLLLFGILLASVIPKPASLAWASGVTALILFAVSLRQRVRHLGSHSEDRTRFLSRLTGGRTACSLLALSLFLFFLGGAILVTGKGQHLFGEPLDPVAGVGMWPSILLRLAAFLVGLLLLIFTCKIFIEGGVRTKKKLEGIDGIFDPIGRRDVLTRSLRVFDAVSGILPVVKKLQTFFGMTPHEPSGFFMDSCLDPALRSRRIVLVSIVYFVVSAILFSIWTPMVPGRGGLPFLIEKLTLSLGVGLYIVHLCLCVELHLSAYGVIRHLTMVVKENHALPIRHVARIANAIGGITTVVGFTLLYPLTILSLLLISRLRLFDDWGMTPSLILTFLSGGIVLVVVSVIIVVQSRKFSAVVADEMARRLAETEAEEDAKELAEAGKDKEAVAAKMKVKALRAEAKEIEEIHEGAFAKWYRQPIFIAALAAVAIFGSLELAQPVLSLFFG